MASVRYLPKSFAVDPKRFGRSATIPWRSVDGDLPGDEDRLVASQMQHSIAYRVRAAIRLRGLTLGDAAAMYDIDDELLGRLLRGDIVMRLDHVAWADRCFNLNVAKQMTAQPS